MGKIKGIRIQNYGALKSICMGKLFSYQKWKSQGNMVTIIGPSDLEKKGKAVFAAGEVYDETRGSENLYTGKSEKSK